jgi:hypothetical protein
MPDDEEGSAMKKTLITTALCGTLGLLAIPEAFASGGRHGHHGHHGHGGRASFGFYFGGPMFHDPWPYYRSYRPWPPPYYYEPRTVIIEREPPVYIQRQATQPPSPAPTAWFYCPNPAGYYPHVPNCSQSWVPVDPATLPPSR